MRHFSGDRDETVRIWSGVSCLMRSSIEAPDTGARKALYSHHVAEGDIFLEPQRAVPPGSKPPQRGLVYRQAPEAPLFLGMPTGPEAFWGMTGVSELWSCAWIHLKMALCYTHSFGRARDKYQLWMDVNSKDRIHYMSSWPGVFKFRIFLSAVLCESWCTFAPETSSSYSFFIIFIYSAFQLYSSLLCISPLNCFVCLQFRLPPVHSPLTIGRIFYYLTISCFVWIAWHCPVTFGVSFFLNYLMIYFFQLCC